LGNAVRILCVTFKWKDYRLEAPERYKLMTLASHEFIRRFLMHVLPAGSVRLLVSVHHRLWLLAFPMRTVPRTQR
jgi:hypothetical protein